MKEKKGEKKNSKKYNPNIPSLYERGYHFFLFDLEVVLFLTDTKKKKKKKKNPRGSPTFIFPPGLFFFLAFACNMIASLKKKKKERKKKIDDSSESLTNHDASVPILHCKEKPIQKKKIKKITRRQANRNFNTTRLTLTQCAL
ncbi:hypothetical protein QBC42DRAFT_25249 [Cladorrhinum samala]|uniref:Transmembrane protein n=1 Tax=Cladorrhinum samala TaxID=585594 RepID=A0AAV9HEF0_9PEZI|nr:hypothetical protein QBC42DRAFT_25249 [Cladorrhinum samala]